MSGNKLIYRDSELAQNESTRFSKKAKLEMAVLHVVLREIDAYIRHGKTNQGELATYILAAAHFLAELQDLKVLGTASSDIILRAVSEALKGNPRSLTSTRRVLADIFPTPPTTSQSRSASSSKFSIV